MNTITKSLPLLSVVFSIAMTGCGNGNNREIIDTDSLSAKVENGLDNLGNKADGMIYKNKEEAFISDAMEENTYELRAARLGQEKGGKTVRSITKEILRDHEKLDEALKAYAAKKNMVLTDVDTLKHDDDLDDKVAGPEFDKAWAEKMVDDHKKTIRLFEEAWDDTQDSELRALISDAIPTLRNHLDHTQKLLNQL